MIIQTTSGGAALPPGDRSGPMLGTSNIGLTSGLKKHRVLALTVLFSLILLPAYLTALRTPAVGLFHDDGVYLVTAKAIAEGEGYRIISLPTEPPQTKYPPGFPVLLSLVWRAFPSFPANVIVLKLVPFTAACMWLILTLRLLLTLGIEIKLAWMITFATAATPWAMYVSTTLLSETLFAALSTGTVLYLENSPVTSRRAVIAGVLASAATLTRSIGISLLIAGAGWLVSRRRYRQAALFTAAAILLLSPWMFWTTNAAGPGYYTFDNYRSWNIFSDAYSIPQKITVVLTNLLWISAAPPSLLSLPAGWPIIAATIAFIVYGVRRIWRRSNLALWFLAVYIAIAACWMWPPFRFMIVVLPLTLWVVVSAFPIGRSRWTTIITCGFSVLAALCCVQIHQNAIVGRERGVLGSSGRRVEDWKTVQEVCTWLQRNTSKDTVVVGNLDPIYYLFTGRKAIRGFEAAPLGLVYGNPAVDAVTAPSELLKSMRTFRSSVLVDSPDYNYLEREAIKSAISSLRQDGTLVLVRSIGDFNVLKPIGPR